MPFPYTGEKSTRLYAKGEAFAMRTEIATALLNEKVTAIVRGIPADRICAVAEALLAGGVRCIEVTFNTPGAAEMIRALKAGYGDKMLVGAGTVLDTETCKTAIDAGADFILSPSLNTAVITMCNRYGKVAVPGVMTPTEILTAMEAGADIVKVFPAGTLGTTYIKDVLGPLNHAAIMAVGGVDAENAAAFFKAGAKCIGVGSALVSKALIEAGDFAAITARAKAFCAAAGK